MTNITTPICRITTKDSSLDIEGEKKESEGTQTVVQTPSIDRAKIIYEDSDEARKLGGDVRTEYSEEEQLAVKKRLDWRVIPLLAAVYLSQFLDKTSLNYR